MSLVCTCSVCGVVFRLSQPSIWKHIYLTPAALVIGRGVKLQDAKFLLKRQCYTIGGMNFWYPLQKAFYIHQKLVWGLHFLAFTTQKYIFLKINYDGWGEVVCIETCKKKCFFRNVVETEYYYSQADKNNILPWKYSHHKFVIIRIPRTSVDKLSIVLKEDFKPF